MLSYIKNKLHKRKSYKYRYFIAPKSQPFIYAFVPKCACTSIKNWLYFLDNAHYIDEPLKIHFNPEYLIFGKSNPELIEQRIDKEFVFTFVRQPLKRAYSCFNEKIFHKADFPLLKDRARFEKHYKITLTENPTLEEHRANFKYFLDYIKQTDKAGPLEDKNNAHWEMQHRIIHKSNKHAK